MRSRRESIARDGLSVQLTCDEAMESQLNGVVRHSCMHRLYTFSGGNSLHKEDSPPCPSLPPSLPPSLTHSLTHSLTAVHCLVVVSAAESLGKARRQNIFKMTDVL